MPSLFSELMRRSTQPILPQIGEGWDAMANVVNDPNSGSSNVPLQTAKGAIGGMMHGVGQVASDATSPLGLLALIAGETGASKIASLAKLAKRTEGAGSALADLPAEFTAVGAEPPVVPRMYPDAQQTAYERIMANRGRAVR